MIALASRALALRCGQQRCETRPTLFQSRWERRRSRSRLEIKITNMKVFGVSLTPDSDRPYVFVKLKRMPVWSDGVKARWRQSRRGHGLCERLPGIHHWQRPDAGRASLAVDAFTASIARPGDRFCHFGHRPSTGDIRGKALGLPVYRLLGGPFDSRGVRGYYHASAAPTRNWLACARRCANTASRASKPASGDTTNGSKRTRRSSAP